MTEPENTTLPIPAGAPVLPDTAPPVPAQVRPAPSAVLDAAHVGDIEGALGRISIHDTDTTRTLKTRLLTLLAILGPGLIVMVGDNDAGGIADLLQQHSTALGSVFAIVLLDASIVGAAAVTLATSYAFGDVFGIKHSLHRGFKDAKQFYFSYTTAVQALAGLLLPSASVFLLLLCNDREVLGPWVNPRWLNAIATLIVAVLLLLSGILMATTLFPTINVVTVSAQIALAMVILGALTAAGLKFTQHHRPAPSPAAAAMSQADKLTWRMPQLALLQPVRWSAGTKVGMLALRGYLVVGAVLLFVKAVQLAGG